MFCTLGGVRNRITNLIIKRLEQGTKPVKAEIKHAVTSPTALYTVGIKSKLLFVWTKSTLS